MSRPTAGRLLQSAGRLNRLGGDANAWLWCSLHGLLSLLPRHRDLPRWLRVTRLLIIHSASPTRIAEIYGMGKATSWLTSYILFLIHLTYALVNAATSLYKLYTTRDPRPLTTKRRQLPSHLAILFACDDDDALDRFEGELLANIEQIVTWCRLVGIKRLTVYDRRGACTPNSIRTWTTRLSALLPMHFQVCSLAQSSHFVHASSPRRSKTTTAPPSLKTSSIP